MLSRDDLQLVERDAALPGLATLLDEEMMLGIIRGIARGRRVGSVRGTYIRYKPGTSCIAGYSVEIEGGLVPLYARTHGADSRAKIAKAVHRPGPAGPLGFGVAAIRNAGVVIFEPPNDDELRSLPRLIRAEGGGLRGADVTLGEHSIAGAKVSTLRSKPERRFVARIDCPDRSFVLKVYTPADFEAIRKRAKQFNGRGILAVPEPAGHRSRYQAILFDWIAGEGLVDLMARDREAGLDGAARLGEALRLVHEHRPSKVIPKCDAACIEDWLHGEISAMMEIDADIGARARDAVPQILTAMGRIEWRKVGLHGDFSYDQALLAGDQVVMFDFDRAMRGDPRIDLGRFAASLEIETLKGRLDEAARDQMLARTFEGYGDDISRNGESIHVFTAAQLLLRAHEPFRLRWTNWRAQMLRLIDRARELCGSECLAGR